MFRYFALTLVFFTSFLVSCKTISEQKERINVEQTTTFSEDANKDIPKKANKNKFLVILFNFK